MRTIRPGILLLPIALVLLSCSDPSAPRTPTSILLVSGGEQTGAVTESLAEPVVVEVRDVDGRAVRGTAVTWTVSAGGGSVSQATTQTDRSGRAQVTWTLGSAAGQNRLSAGVTGVAPTAITATARAGSPATAAIVSGNGQTGLEMLPLGEALVVAVQDAHGNGVPGTTVTFAPTSGVVTPQAVTTDASGVASALWTLGPAGAHAAAVSAAGLPAPLQINATALALGAMTELENDAPVGGIGASEGENRYYRIILPAQVTQLTVSTTGGPGDVDLFVRHARLPTTSSHACRSTTPFAAETCTIDLPAPGDWFVLLDAFSAYSGVTIRATYSVGGNMNVNVTGLPQGTPADIVVTGPDRYEQRVTQSGPIAALTPGTYTVSAAFVRGVSAVYVPTPELQQIQVSAGAPASVVVDYAAASGTLNLDIVRAYITQSVQRMDGSIPLVAGRDGLLRVFARGDAVSSAMPAVRVRLYHGGSLASTITIPAPSATLPVSHDERLLTSTWNVIVPGALIQPGASLVVDVDPADEVAESDETDNSFPESGTPLALDVRTAATLQARLVPVVQNNGLTADVTDANRDTYVTDAHALYPLPAIDVDVRAAYSFSGTLASSYDSTWQRLLNEINALRLAEAPARYYYGVIKPAYTQGGTGLGFINQRAAIGVDWTNWRAETVAHEWGHNFGRFHVDCGGPSGVDTNYPYAAGRIGHHGYDMRTNEILPLESHYDLMSYCSPTWASDYTYEAVLAFRGAQAGVAAAGVSEPALLVWGRISPDGAVLEPSFQVVATPALPRSPGPYRLTGVSAKGATVLDVSFDAYEVDHMPGVRMFAYTIPLSAMGGEAPAELRLRGAGAGVVRRRSSDVSALEVRAERETDGRVRLQWDVARAGVLMVRDGRTGEIISFARGGDARVTTNAAEVEIIMGDGTRNGMRRIAVPR